MVNIYKCLFVNIHLQILEINMSVLNCDNVSNKHPPLSQQPLEPVDNTLFHPDSPLQWAIELSGLDYNWEVAPQGVNMFNRVNQL